MMTTYESLPDFTSEKPCPRCQELLQKKRETAMPDLQRLDTTAHYTLRDVLNGDSPLEPTKKLARMLGGSGASFLETHSFSTLMPPGDFSAHCSREISGAQVTNKGDFLHATLHP